MLPVTNCVNAVKDIESDVSLGSDKSAFDGSVHYCHSPIRCPSSGDNSDVAPPACKYRKQMTVKHSQQSKLPTTVTTFHRHHHVEKSHIKRLVSFQAICRGYMFRRRFSRPDELLAVREDAPLFVQSNDPKVDSFQYLDQGSPYIYVCCGGVSILEHMLNWLPLGKKPLIFVVDFSINNKKFWNEVKKSFREAATAEDVIETWKKNGLDNWFNHDYLMAKSRVVGIKPECYDFKPLPEFFLQLMQGESSRNFEYFKQLVTSRVINITQHWADEATFRFIKEIANYHQAKICVFASNIPECALITQEKWKGILDNIRFLQPNILVESDYGRFTGVPSRIFVYKGKELMDFLDTSEKELTEAQRMKRKEVFEKFFEGSNKINNPRSKLSSLRSDFRKAKAGY